MRRHHISWDIGCAMLSTYDVDGFLEVQPDAEGENDSGVLPYEAHTFGGFLHRPLDPVVDDEINPDESQACNLLIAMEESGKPHCFVLEDPRVIQQLPLLQKGETVVHGDAGQFTRYFADGSIVDMTTTAGGASTGVAITYAFTPTGTDLVAPWGRQSFDQYGWRVATHGGAALNIGYAGGIIPGIGSFCSMQGDMVEIDGAAIAIGPTGVPALSVAKAAPLLSILALIVQAIVDANTAGALVATASGLGPGTYTKAATSASAALSAVSAGLQAIATQTVIG